MKKFFLLFSILIPSFSCKAQIFDLYNTETDYGAINNAYYKDTSGFLDQFAGTWIFINGNTSLTLIFQKKNSLIYNDGVSHFRQDLLIGEYKYIEDGQEKINTLLNISRDFGNNYIFNRDGYNLTGWMDLTSNLNPKCLECLPREKRLRMTLGEPGYDGMGIASNSFVIRRFFENGVEKLKVWFVDENQIYIVDDAGNHISPAPYKLPLGEYVLTKVN